MKKVSRHYYYDPIEHDGVKYLFFLNGPFSNWYPSVFTVDDVIYNCGEQYMMHQKALMFKDEEIAEKIMKSEFAGYQKQLGRKVRNFDKESWDSQSFDIVYKGLKEKFLQNDHLYRYLKTYEDCKIVEAADYDRIWGIGYDWEHAIGNINDWGENRLGNILTKLNEII